MKDYFLYYMSSMHDCDVKISNLYNWLFYLYTTIKYA